MNDNKRFIQFIRQRKQDTTRLWTAIQGTAETEGVKVLEKYWKPHELEDIKYSTIKTKDSIKLRVTGTEVLFYEFGSGITYSSLKHPEAGENNMGPGTFDGKGLWDNPNGWWYEVRPGRKISGKTMVTKKGKELAHTYGRPAYMPSYKASHEIAERIKKKYGGKNG